MRAPTHLYRWDSATRTMLAGTVTVRLLDGLLAVEPREVTRGSGCARYFGNDIWTANHLPGVRLYPSEVAALEAREAELRAWTEEHAAVVRALRVARGPSLDTATAIMGATVKP